MFRPVSSSKRHRKICTYLDAACSTNRRANIHYADWLFNSSDTYDRGCHVCEKMCFSIDWYYWDT